MSRFGRTHKVCFFEEPIFEEENNPHLRISQADAPGVMIATPLLPHGLSPSEVLQQQKRLLATLLREEKIETYLVWYYTPMAREYAFELRPVVTVYDCMDELSGFAGAPPSLQENERALFAEADLVFTGGASLYGAKREQHRSVHLFPSSVDVRHFGQARGILQAPEDQVKLAHPRLGYAGVIDERMDLSLLKELADMRPEWQFILLGPVVKIDPATLPEAANIHYLGLKTYDQLPAYLAGWEIGMLPFALNDATRFISPTKTPEYLAAGLRVISTPIQDVVSAYGEQGLVGIARSPEEFVEIAEVYLGGDEPQDDFRMRADRFLARSSWDTIWYSMNELISEVAVERPSHV